MTEGELISLLLPSSKEASIIFFDVGANSFSFGLYTKQIYPNATVYGFEADITVFNTAAKNKKIVKTDGLHYFNKAVSDINGVATFYPSLSWKDKEHRASGSICVPVVDETTNTMLNGYHNLRFDMAGYEIETTRLDTFCAAEKITNIDYLHIDVQGAEDKVIRGMGELRPKYVYAETNLFGTSLYETTTTLGDFDTMMTSLGYSIFDRTNSDTLYTLNN